MQLPQLPVFDCDPVCDEEDLSGTVRRLYQVTVYSACLFMAVSHGSVVSAVACCQVGFVDCLQLREWFAPDGRYTRSS